MAIHSLTGPDASGVVGTVSKTYDDALAADVLTMLAQQYNWTPFVGDPSWQSTVTGPGGSGTVPNPTPQPQILNPKQIGMLMIEDAEIYWTGKLRIWAKQQDDIAAAAIITANQNRVNALVSAIPPS